VGTLNFNHLYYFVVVAQEGSVTRASQRIHVTQPTLSGQLGQLEEAKALFSLEQDSSLRLLLSAYVKYLSGDDGGFKALLQTWVSDQDNLDLVTPFEIVLLARAGLTDAAQLFLARIPPPPHSTLDSVEAARGVVLIARGNLGEGRKLVETALECPLSDEIFPLAADSLAGALEEESEREAVRTLERALQRRFLVGGGTSAQWPLYARLLRLYERSGEESERAQLARRIREALKTADEDHPLLRATRFLDRDGR